MSIVDANIILRYVLDDHTELSPKAAEILEQQQQTTILTLEVACEVVYVLQKVYVVEREDIQQYLSNLLRDELVVMEKAAVFLAALEQYSTSTLDFVDSLLWAYHAVERQEIHTFDNKLNKLIQQTDSDSLP
jgi:predicted nucleic-acid-binding protein